MCPDTVNTEDLFSCNFCNFWCNAKKHKHKKSKQTNKQTNRFFGNTENGKEEEKSSKNLCGKPKRL